MLIKDHKDNLNRELSLVEQKKMQWAKEREEMAKLEQYHSNLSQKYERNTIRTQLITNTEIVQQNNNYQQKNFAMRQLRSPSLPPIDKAMTRQGSNNSDQSSGYLSGSGGSTSLPPNSNVIETSTTNPFDFKYGQARLDGLNDKFQQSQQPPNDHRSMKNHSMTSSLNEYSSMSTHEQDMDFNNGHKSLGSPSSETSSITSHDIFSVSSYANSSAIDSSVNYQKSREGGRERAKWSSYLFDPFSKENGRCSRSTTNGPVWLEKSLSEARDSEEETMSISMRSVASFLRGQNVPVDPMILAERESKRRKAMELQEAIKQQLHERENLKKIEREKQYQIEKMEEERLSKQVDMERKRLEYEQNLQFEKLEAEKNREEQMRKALEKAALEAQHERERKRRERVVMQNAIDETISIQKIGEKTEIFIDQKPQSGYRSAKSHGEINESPPVTHTPIPQTPIPRTTHTPVSRTPIPQTPILRTLAPESNVEDEEEDDDGETVLIGTPIKLKKKNLDTFRRKFHKRQQNVDESKNTSEDEMSTTKSTRSTESNSENLHEKSPKIFSELDGIALVLQSMPLVPFMPITNDYLAINHLNNLALLMAAQNRLNASNIALPIISKDMTTAAINAGDKLDLSQFIIPPTNQQTITLQIQQVEPRYCSHESAEGQNRFRSVPHTPDTSVSISFPKALGSPIILAKELTEPQQQSVPSTPDDSTIKGSPPPPTPQVPHDGTFTKEECHTHDAFTSTSTENRFVDEEREVKILTPQKYRHEVRSRGSVKTTGTQTESFLYCEYCSYQHQSHHHHQCTAQTAEEAEVVAHNSQTEATKAKDKKSENRPAWGVRNPPVKYLKASERDPFYGKNRKKRYLKKAASESEKTDDTCSHRDCPLVKSPLLPKRFENFERENLCKSMLPIKYDRFGRICLMDEQIFIKSEAMRRVYKSDPYTSDAESSIDTKHKSFFLPRSNDFQDIFVD